MRQAGPAPAVNRSGQIAGRATLGLRRGILHLPAWALENLEHSLPFLLGGAVCIGLGVWLHLSQPAQLGSRASLWMLLAAVGVTLGGGGLALTLIEESPMDEPPGGDADYVMVSRSVWEAWQGAGALPPTMPPGGEPSPPWDESIPAPPPDSSAPAAGPVPAPYDSTLVANVSDDLLRAQRPVGEGRPTGPPYSPAGAGGPPSGPTGVAGGPPVAAVLRTPAPPPPPGTVPGPRARPPISAAWQEDAIHELESVLQQFGHGPVSSLPEGEQRAPAPLIDRCIACGAAVTGYSEQACVVCDRPLCDRCLERSVSEGRPAVCPTCPPPADA